MVNHQKVLFYLLLYGKKYCDEKGKFNLSYEKIIYHTDFGSRTTVNKCITDLDSMGYIKIVSRNSRFDKMSMKRAPNVYQLINYYILNEEDVALTLSYNEINCDNSFFKTMVRFFGKDNLNIVFTRAVKVKLLNTQIAS